MGNFRMEVFFGTPCIEQYFMVLSCIDTVVVITSDWRDTGDVMIENLTNLPPAAGYM